MKKWIRPLTEVQDFVANEYVAACGESGTTYKFDCNANGDLWYYPTRDDKLDGVYKGNGAPDHLGGVHGCPRYHEVESTEIFYEGFLDNGTIDGKYDSEDTMVIVKVDRGLFGGIFNWHATTNLVVEDWETAKS